MISSSCLNQVVLVGQRHIRTNYRPHGQHRCTPNEFLTRVAYTKATRKLCTDFGIADVDSADIGEFECVGSDVEEEEVVETPPRRRQRKPRANTRATRQPRTNTRTRNQRSAQTSVEPSAQVPVNATSVETTSRPVTNTRTRAIVYLQTTPVGTIAHMPVDMSSQPSTSQSALSSSMSPQPNGQNFSW